MAAKKPKKRIDPPMVKKSFRVGDVNLYPSKPFNKSKSPFRDKKGSGA